MNRKDDRRIHLIGVAGSGMSALAELLLGAGCRVSGSDRDRDRGLVPPVLRKLAAAGLELAAQDGSGIGRDTDLAVYSGAVEAGNPDLAAAASLGIRTCARSELLRELTEGRRLVGVAGTSGKSTVTGMIGWTLERMGADPTVVNGAAVLNWTDEIRLGSTRRGAGELWVAELDESDRSLLRFEPEYAVITNTSRDHFDLEETRRLFAAFRGRVRGAVVDEAALRAAERTANMRETAAGVEFSYGGALFEVGLLGRHNGANALQAVMLCERLGYWPAALAAALREFRGVHRRLERLGTAGGVTVIDDAAHNPAKIAAALRAASSRYAGVHAVWRPHGYGPLAFMFDELVETFARGLGAAGRAYILPVYYAGGTATVRVRSADLAAALAGAGVAAVPVPDADGLIAALAGTVGDGEAILVMGARDPELPALARRCLAFLAGRGGHG